MTSTQSCIRRGSDPATGCFWPASSATRQNCSTSLVAQSSLPLFCSPKARLKQFAQRASSSVLISKTVAAIAWAIARVCFRPAAFCQREADHQDRRSHKQNVKDEGAPIGSGRLCRSRLRLALQREADLEPSLPTRLIPSSQQGQPSPSLGAAAPGRQESSAEVPLAEFCQTPPHRLKRQRRRMARSPSLR